ncbi:diguanylate cyclase domain-containing protein [Aquipuribacter sp. SD81]|uniref:diguanylate cyclase domain-containing protein n=1 Tax=Aquipuribacter sp. SD81 TaxID=3127703 RepID=UPI0030168C19
MRRSLLLLVAFTIAALLGRLTATDGLGGLALVWPAAGVAVLWAAAVPDVRTGVRDGVLMGAATFAVHDATGVPLADTGWFVAANLVHAAVGATLLAAFGARRRRLDSAAVGGAIVAASFAAAAAGAVVVAGAPDYVGTTTGALLVLVRNAVGTVLVLAVARTWPPSRDELVPARRREALLLLLATLGGYGLAFVVGDGLNIAYSVVPLTLWAALRLGRFLTSAHLVLTGVLTVWLTVAGYGPFAASGTDPATRVVLAQGFLAVLACVAVSIAVSRHERDDLLGAVRASEARVRRSLDTALAGHLSVRLRPDGRTAVIGSANPATAVLLRRPVADLLGADWLTLLEPSHAAEVTAGLVSVAEGRDPSWQGTAEVVLPDGAPRWVQLLVGPDLVGEAGHDVHGARLTVQMLDATDRVDVERRLTLLALHDDLTGLPNRTLLLDRLDQQLAASGRDGTAVGLLFLDLDRFKAVNDTHGHATGDELLVLVAQRLLASVRPLDTVARLGGDEFVVCCPGLASVEAGLAVADRLLEVMAEPLVVGGEALDVGVSGGLTLSGPGEDARGLLERADAAMYRAKRSGRGRITTEAVPSSVPSSAPLAVARSA